MTVLKDKHGNPLRSVSSSRVDYLMTLEEFQELVRAMHNSRSEIEAKVNCNKVWKKLGDKYGFDWRSVHRSTEGNRNPRVFSAIPKKNEDDVPDSVQGRPEQD